MLVAARTHDYGKQPVDHLAKLLKSEGIEAAQLVLPKAFSEINSYDEVTPRLVEQIRRNFEEENVKRPGGKEDLASLYDGQCCQTGRRGRAA